MEQTKKMFFDAISYDNEEFSFKAKNMMVAVANTLRRAMMSEILSFTISPDTIQFKTNTSPWDNDMLINQLVYIPLLQKTLSEKDLNMLELSLHAKNDTQLYRWVLAEEMSVRNKETNEIIPIELIVQSMKNPLFTLGPRQEVNVIASFEILTKVELDGTHLAARHQASTVGYEFEADMKDRSVIPSEIKFNVSAHLGLSHHEHVQYAFNAIIQKVKAIHDSVSNGKFYIQLNKDHRYDIILMNEGHTMGNLIARWIDRHDTNAFCAYNDTRDRKAITIDFGLFKFAPPLLQMTETDTELKDVVEKSLLVVDPSIEQLQRVETIKSFSDHLNRIVSYMETLLEEWNKIKFVKSK